MAPSSDEATNINVNIADTNNFKSFEYKTRLTGSTAAAYGILEMANNCCTTKIFN